MPEVSVVIPVRNGERDLPVQLAALAREPEVDAIEVIIADNGSTDSTAAVAEQHRAAIPGLRVLDASGKPCQAHALNVGIGAAKSDLILLLDADDEIAPGYVEAMVRALAEHEFVAARMDLAALNAPWVQGTRPADQQTGVGTPFGLHPAAATCTLGMRRELFDRIGTFDEGLSVCQDIDFAWRAAQAGVELEFVPDAVLRYRYRATLRSIYRQAKGYGAAGPALYVRWRTRGMPKRGWRTNLRYWGAVIVRAGKLRSRTDLGAWVFLVGLRVGTIRGALRERVLYL